MKNIIKNEKGQSLVEFAIVLPILLLIVMGIAELGMILNSYLTIQNISREVARLGSVGATDTDIQNIISSNSTNLNQQNLVVSLAPVAGARNSGDTITAVVTYDYHLTVPIISGILKNDVVIKTQTSMRIE
ncbi:MAG: TadE/TadG family type IV pilus assembly protein [Bacillota bacterium]|nr:TadE/TadG family type IV pilus assembly protein [Bacillota bacterium]